MASLEYPGWLRARRDWRELTRDGTLFTILLMKARAQDIGDAPQLWAQWQPHLESLTNSERGFAQQRWNAGRALIACAQIAGIDPNFDSSAQLSEVLAALQSAIAVEEQTARSRSDSGLTAAATDANRSDGGIHWDESVRERLRGLQWEPPMSVAWAWDAISSFKDQSRKVVATESMKVLLAGAKEEGILAQLTLEALDGAGDASFFADPATMSFVHCDQAFWDGVNNARLYVRDALRLWPGERGQPDVRWRLTRQDGSPLIEIAGGSAGAAFAMVLAKLAAR